MDFSQFSEREVEARADQFLVDDTNDWALTLLNISKLSEMAKDARERQASAEKRAELAERKAEEALLWLRRLHQAVSEAMPRAPEDARAA